MKKAHDDGREQKLVEEKAKNEAAIVERLKQELKARDDALLGQRRIEAIESERQQGIYVQNRMNERMRETGLPRMAANATDFEVLAAQWTYVWGDRDVEVTSQTHDAGIDVQSWNCLGQVKFYSNGKVGAPEVQQLRGATSVDNSRFATFLFSVLGIRMKRLILLTRLGLLSFSFTLRPLPF